MERMTMSFLPTRLVVVTKYSFDTDACLQNHLFCLFVCADFMHLSIIPMRIVANTVETDETARKR